MRSTDIRQRLRKKKYLEQEGLCYYCCGPMIFFDKYPKGGGPTIKNMVTLEHLCIGVLGEKKDNKKTVAACASCNQAQATEQAHVYIHYQQMRSTKAR